MLSYLFLIKINIFKKNRINFIMGNSSNEDKYGMKIRMAGESLYLFHLYLSKSIYTITKSSDKKEKKDIFDFWDSNYKFNMPFEKQIEEIFEYYKELKQNFVLNFKELLIVHITNTNSKKIDYIFSKMNEIKRPYYMPVVLFLCDEYNDDYKIKPNKSKYRYINENNIYTESFINDKEYLFDFCNELTISGKLKMKKINKILLRICSYYNDLGDSFFIPEISKNFNLSDKNYPYNINICCVGRFGKGKSTCVNCILGEQKSRESKSGTSTTKKIHCYQVKDEPIMIYDIPGFESIETTNEAIDKIKELNNNENELKKRIHIFLYIIKSIDDRMFAEIEYQIIKKLSEQNNISLLYVITHSSTETNKEEKIDSINEGIKGILEKHPNSENNIIASKMNAFKDNCVFVNFHSENNKPIYGINDLFLKIFSKLTINQNNIYFQYYESQKTSLEFNAYEFNRCFEKGLKYFKDKYVKITNSINCS